MALKGVYTSDWALSLREQGNTVDGIFDIHQCIHIILMTIKGSDPLRPTFGCDIYSFLDAPINSALPNMIRSIVDAIGVWETRVELQRVTYELSDYSSVKFKLEWTLTASAINQVTDFELFLNGNNGTRDTIRRFLISESGIQLTAENGIPLGVDASDVPLRYVISTDDFNYLATENNKILRL